MDCGIKRIAREQILRQISRRCESIPQLIRKRKGKTLHFGCVFFAFQRKKNGKVVEALNESLGVVYMVVASTGKIVVIGRP